MNVSEYAEVPLTKSEVVARCRSLAATVLVFAVTLRLFHKNGGYADAFQFHPICMMVAFVMVLPDVISGVKQLKKKKQKASTPESGSAPQRPVDKGLHQSEVIDRGEVILRHQLAALALEVAAAGGFAAVEYVKISNRRPHLISPHGVVGAVCGAAILCQMILGTLLRYVFTPGQCISRQVLAAHKLTSLVIVLTGMMGIVGGFLSTAYAELMIPSAAVRTGIALASVGLTVLGLVA